MAFRRGCIRKKKPPRLPLYSDPTRWHCSQWNGIPQMCTKSESTPKLFGCYVQAVHCFYAVYGWWFSGWLSLGVLIPSVPDGADSPREGEHLRQRQRRASSIQRTVQLCHSQVGLPLGPSVCLPDWCWLHSQHLTMFLPSKRENYLTTVSEPTVPLGVWTTVDIDRVTCWLLSVFNSWV